MIRNVFKFFDSFLVGKNEYENTSLFCVAKYVGNINNLTNLKISGRCYNFLPFFGTEVVKSTKDVCEIFEGNKCDIFRSQKLHMHKKNVLKFMS